MPSKFIARIVPGSPDAFEKLQEMEHFIANEKAEVANLLEIEPNNERVNQLATELRANLDMMEGDIPFVRENINDEYGSSLLGMLYKAKEETILPVLYAFRELVARS